MFDAMTTAIGHQFVEVLYCEVKSIIGDVEIFHKMPTSVKLSNNN